MMAEDLALDVENFMHHFITSEKGVRVHFVSAGSFVSKHAPIMLVHGWPDCWYGWRHQIKCLAQHGYRVYACDLRGMGATKVDDPVDVKKFTFLRQNEDILAIMKHEKIPKIVIIGHDWGAPTTWHFARRFPWRVAAVGALLGPYRPRKRVYIPIEDLAKSNPRLRYQIYLGYSSDKAAEELDNNVQQLVKAIFRSSSSEDRIGSGKWMGWENNRFLENYPSLENMSFSQLLTPEEYDNYVKVWKKSGFRASLNWYATSKINFDEEYTPGSERHPTNPDFVPTREIALPALMVTAGKDHVLPKSMADGMEAWMPQLSRAHVEQAAHWLQQEQKDDVNRILLNWLHSLPKADPIYSNL